MTNLDPNEFVIVPGVAVLDEFSMTDSTGGMVTTIDARFLVALCSRMNEREIRTGDLSPYVLGHTTDGDGENDQPQILGFARNWVVGPFFDTGKQAAFVDLWIRKINKLILDGKEVILTAKEVADRWPRRSAEVWTDRHEIDPISALGPTTPARDLGLLKLSRNGSFTYSSPGATQVPLPTPPMDAATQAAAGAATAPAESQQATLNQILAAIQKLTDSLAPPAPAGGVDPAAAGPTGAPPGAPGADGGISDEELMAMLSGGGEQGAPPGAPQGAPPTDDSSRAGDEPVKNQGGYPGGTNTMVQAPQVRLERLAGELADTRLKLARMEISNYLGDLRGEGYNVDSKDEELISDLAAQPAEMRARSLQRIVKLSKKTPTNTSHNLESAVEHSNTGRTARVQSVEDNMRVIKLARDKKITYETAAAELGFTV